MNVLGVHLLVEFWDCDREKIDNPSYLEKVMSRAAQIAGANILKTLFQKFNPHGVSGVLMIESSHLTIHTWPEYRYAAVDIFTGGSKVDPWKAVDSLKQALEAGATHVSDFQRGIPATDRQSPEHPPCSHSGTQHTKNEYPQAPPRRSSDGLSDEANALRNGLSKRTEVRKDEEFLSQIPDWEKDYKESDELYIKFEKRDWVCAEATYSPHDLKIMGEAVMEDWETPYMMALAQIAAEHGGIVLELGFGMGISSHFIQQYNIEKHIVIEANKQVAERARKFAEKSVSLVEVLEGFWEDVIEVIPDASVAGILFDTYPLQEEELYQNHFNFFPFAHSKLKLGGVFTYG